MQSSRCAFSAAAALQRVFIAPIGRPMVSQLRTQLRPQRTPEPLNTSLSQNRAYVSSVFPHDEQLINQNFPYVHIVDEAGKLSPPQRVADILTSINRRTQSLQTLALPPPKLRSRWEQPPEPIAGDRGGAPEIPVCRIVDKKAAREAVKVRSKKQSNPAMTLKTLELNWAIDPHDLEHRLKRMRDFLEKGYRVDVVLVGKRKKRKASPEEAAQTLDKIREAIKMVDGAKEWKGMEGKVGAHVMLFIEGKAKKDDEGERE